jgi:hypothetical protein
MKLKFITSISKEYWDETAKHCISTWDLPGEVIVYIDQKEGDIGWVEEVPFRTVLLNVPKLKEDYGRNKVFKFWGKANAQMITVYDFLNRRNDAMDDPEVTEIPHERVIWLDADIEQTAPVTEEMFTFDFEEPLGMMNSSDGHDCWETGIVIFNQQYFKLRVVMNLYKEVWKDPDIMNSLWKPYDAQVLGYVANERGYYNLCERKCKNVNAVENSIYSSVFKHWINKENKEQLRNENG